MGPAQQSPYPPQNNPGFTPYNMPNYNTPIATPVYTTIPRGDTVGYGEHPVLILCQFCHQAVHTNIRSKNSMYTWLMCAGICFLTINEGAKKLCKPEFGCPLGCCLIPFFLDCAKIQVHSCPNCSKEVGVSSTN